MNYEQALDKKESMNSGNFTQGGLDFKVFVTPSNKNDFLNYLGAIRGFYDDVTDSDALLYSRDGTYSVYALSFDGINIVYKVC